jgi:hypothetical protein
LNRTCRLLVFGVGVVVVIGFGVWGGIVSGVGAGRGGLVGDGTGSRRGTNGGETSIGLSSWSVVLGGSTTTLGTGAMSGVKLWFSTTLGRGTVGGLFGGGTGVMVTGAGTLMVVGCGCRRTSASSTMVLEWDSSWGGGRFCRSSRRVSEVARMSSSVVGYGIGAVLGSHVTVSETRSWRDAQTQAR